MIVPKEGTDLESEELYPRLGFRPVWQECDSRHEMAKKWSEWTPSGLVHSQWAEFYVNRNLEWRADKIHREVACRGHSSITGNLGSGPVAPARKLPLAGAVEVKETCLGTRKLPMYLPPHDELATGAPTELPEDTCRGCS